MAASEVKFELKLAEEMYHLWPEVQAIDGKFFAKKAAFFLFTYFDLNSLQLAKIV